MAALREKPTYSYSVNAGIYLLKVDWEIAAFLLKKA